MTTTLEEAMQTMQVEEEDHTQCQPQERKDPRRAWIDEVEGLQASWRQSMYAYLPTFTGFAWRLCDRWLSWVPVPDGPIRYLEIGTLCGANLISVSKTYGKHPDSHFDVIDPWVDCHDYNEYLTPNDFPFHIQSNNYLCFRKNIIEAGIEHMVTEYRDLSHHVLPYLKDDSYDIIYVDGNHNKENVLEDGVLAFRKCKVGGWLLFDDYGWGGPDATQAGIDAFLRVYGHRLTNIKILNGQAYCQRAN